MKLPVLALLGALIALPAAAHDGVHIVDPFARIMGPAGAAYFRIVNHAAAEDTLISATSPDAAMVMLMNNHQDANGVMKMGELPDGMTAGAEDEHVLHPGGDHVMLMELTHKIADGDKVTVILTFKKAGNVTVTIPVDNKRTEEPGAGPTPFDVGSGEN